MVTRPVSGQGAPLRRFVFRSGSVARLLCAAHPAQCSRAGVCRQLRVRGGAVAGRAGIGTHAVPGSLLGCGGTSPYFFLTLLRAVVARAGCVGVVVDVRRVTFWGALAMAITAGVRGRCSARWSDPRVSDAAAITFDVPRLT